MVALYSYSVLKINPKQPSERLVCDNKNTVSTGNFCEVVCTINGVIFDLNCDGILDFSDVITLADMLLPNNDWPKCMSTSISTNMQYNDAIDNLAILYAEPSTNSYKSTDVKIAVFENGAYDIFKPLILRGVIVWFEFQNNQTFHFE